MPQSTRVARPTAFPLRVGRQFDRPSLAGLRGPCNIDGTGFGDHGTLTVDGQIVATNRWRDDSIKGDKLPSTFRPGSLIKIVGNAVIEGKHEVLETVFTYGTPTPADVPAKAKK